MAPVQLTPEATVVRPLTAADHAASVAVENAAFTNPNHRASPDKIAYRLDACPELCYGVFAPESGSSETVLVAHIIATRCRDSVVTDASMSYPPDWRTRRPTDSDNDEAIGHQPGAPTVAVHSLAVAPAAQRSGVGQRLVKAYLGQMARLEGVHRVALICQDHLVDYYTKLGFELEGPSAAQFGGGGWLDMVCDVRKA